MYFALALLVVEMGTSRFFHLKFFRNESGAVTVDWVALTAAALLTGMVVLYAIYSEGWSAPAELVHRYV